MKAASAPSLGFSFFAAATINGMSLREFSPEFLRSPSPTTPDGGATPFQKYVGTAHYIFAGLLFSTLAVFCLVLFRMSAHGHALTPGKVLRNRVYTVCGIVILASMAAILLLIKVLNVKVLFGGLGTIFFFETTSLLAFGVAWLVKGQTLFKDQ